MVMGAAATEPAALRAFARSGYGVGCAKMGGGGLRGCDDVAPSRNRQVLLSLRERGRRPFTQHTHWQGTLLECGSRPSLACTSTRALRSGSDGVARWWRRHGDEQEAGPVSAALLNAFLNSADFFLSCLHVVESCDRRKPGTAADVLLAAGTLLIASAILLLLLLRRRSTPQYRASRAIGEILSQSARIDDEHARDDKPPSNRLRARRPVGYIEPARAVVRDRVRAVAHELCAVPERDGGAIRRISPFEVRLPDVVWEPHGSTYSLVDNGLFLPRLHSAVADDRIVPWPLYHEQLSRRRRGGVKALWQKAQRGAVTLPHVDVDLRHVTMQTYIAVLEGVELIIAWRQDELHEDSVLSDIFDAEQASLAMLHSVPSLTIICAKAGDLIYMPRDTVHMVVTERDKIHFAFHVYDDE